MLGKEPITFLLIRTAIKRGGFAFEEELWYYHEKTAAEQCSVAWPGSIPVSFASFTNLFPCSLKSCLPNDSGFVPDPGDMGRE